MSTLWHVTSQFIKVLNTPYIFIIVYWRHFSELVRTHMRIQIYHWQQLYLYHLPPLFNAPWVHDLNHYLSFTRCSLNSKCSTTKNYSTTNSPTFIRTYSHTPGLRCTTWSIHGGRTIASYNIYYISIGNKHKYAHIFWKLYWSSPSNSWSGCKIFSPSATYLQDKNKSSLKKLWD